MMDAAPAQAEAWSGDAPPMRLVFDLTTTALWSGPPAGIVRVEREFARWALDHVDGLALGFFDPETRAFRHLDRDVADILISQKAVIDTLSFVNPARRGKRKTDRIPAVVRPAAMWLLQSRRMALQAMERIRLRTGNARIAALTDRLQRAIMSAKYRAIMVNADGSRCRFLPVDTVLARPLALTARDTLVCAGAGWVHNDIEAIAAAKRKVNFRFVLFCHDVIPLMFPHFYKRADIEAQRRYYDFAFPAADLVIFGSRTVAADVRDYCGARGITLGATAVCPLGADGNASTAPVPLPAGLEAGRYALLVSTIEPRKGHRLIYDIWVKLIEAGIPQRSHFKLVFAGREGWMVGDLMRDLRRDPRIAGTLEVFTDADDTTLATLYRNAAFCLYPSRYEGYGLPVVEAFRYGKAVLASNGGAVPEVVDGLSPCLDPTDDEVWRLMLQTWIEDPAARVVYEARIRTSFRHPDWDESARAFFALVRGDQSVMRRS
jgi:glycosyltransferase involved in cell wall biosynthesis